MKKQFLSGVAMALLLASSLVSAADVAAGKAKAAVCSGCHGPNGVSLVDMYPNLAGQKALYLSTQLKAFKSGKRDNAIMKGMVASLSDADIENLAAYFASLK